MLSRQPLVIAGAAMLGTVALLGTNVANGAIDLDSADKSVAAATYASETVSTATDRIEDVDGVKYYVLDGGESALDVSGMAGVNSSGQNTNTWIDFTFTNAVLTAGSTPVATITPTDGTATTLVAQSGGVAGSKEISYNVANLQFTSTAAIALTIEEIAWSGSGNVGVSMGVEVTVGGRDFSDSASYTNAVVVESGLEETSVATDALATVENSFLDFGGDGVANLGSFRVAAKSGVLSADDGDTVALADMILVDDDGSTMIFDGEFAFADGVVLDTDDECTTAQSETNNILMTDADGDVTGTSSVQLADANGRNLCIHVDGSASIPDTDAYVVTTTYAAAADDALSPTTGGSGTLGEINRDGTTVQLPYLSTYEGYNQRIVISNRSGNDAAYFLTFRAVDGAQPTAGMDAEGTLAAGETKTLSLRSDDVVSVEEGTRTAAELVVEATRTNVDVSTVTVNREDRSTDTVVY